MRRDPGKENGHFCSNVKCLVILRSSTKDYNGTLKHESLIYLKNYQSCGMIPKKYTMVASWISIILKLVIELRYDKVNLVFLLLKGPNKMEEKKELSFVS